ncbi:MAG: PorP/SprF family type IX secretion system membrane protein [Saprospiraceae bacterium]
MKKLILLSLGVICSYFVADAQQLPLFTQYRENTTLINPASFNHDYLLNEHNISFGASYRRQWTDLKSGPQTQTVRGEYIFDDIGNFALVAGGYLLNDKTGPTGLTGVYGRFAGVITDDPYYGGLSIGLSAGAVQYRVNINEIRLRDPNDVLGMDDQSQIHPDVGFGVYAYKLLDGGGFLDESHVYAGLSVPQVIGLDLEFKEEGADFSTKRIQHFYGQVGLYKYIGDGFIQPSAWVKYVPNAPVNVDFNLRYQMQGSFWLGAGASTAGNAHIETGLLIGEGAGFDSNFRIGYGFDYSFSSFGPFAGGTHEINLSYSFGN